MATIFELTSQYAALMDRYDMAADDAERAEAIEMLD